MKRAVAVIIMVVVAIAFATTGFAQKPAPKTVTLAKAAKLGPVTFNHEKHQAMKGADKKEIPCTTCHESATGGAIKAGMFHTQKPSPKLDGGCLDCHKKPESTNAPKMCGGCHKKPA